MTEVAADTEAVGVLAPFGRDAPLTCELLSAHGVVARALNDVRELASLIPLGLGAAVVTEEALTAAALAPLEEAVAAQPPWSDFPLVLLSSHGFSGTRPIARLARLGNVTVVDRPVHVRTLVSTVTAALRARRRQYQARKAIELRDRFLAMLGHELRNPLGAIVFATGGLRAGASGEAITRAVETLQRQSRHLTRLVDDLLEVSRVTTGRIHLEQKVVDLKALLERTLAAFAPWVQSQRMQLSLDAGEARVLGDEVRLEQVFSNLLTNALKYTPAGGAVWVTLGHDGENATVRVRDNGIGLEPQMKERIFELFAQADTAIDRSRGGLGLGLTLVRRLVELHGGTVEARSDGLGMGTELVVALPRTDQPLEVRATPRPAPVKAMRLALVEDNPDIRETLKELLELEGHQVEASGDGTTGLALITRAQPEIAFVDLGLPGLDGYQVAERVREKLGTRVWLVALSGYGQPEDRERALKAGFDAHLTKPVDVEGLKQAMRLAQQGLRRPPAPVPGRP